MAPVPEHALKLIAADDADSDLTRRVLPRWLPQPELRAGLAVFRIARNEGVDESPLAAARDRLEEAAPLRCVPST